MLTFKENYNYCRRARGFNICKSIIAARKLQKVCKRPAIQITTGDVWRLMNTSLCIDKANNGLNYEVTARLYQIDNIINGMPFFTQFFNNWVEISTARQLAEVASQLDDANAKFLTNPHITSLVNQLHDEIAIMCGDKSYMVYGPDDGSEHDPRN